MIIEGIYALSEKLRPLLDLRISVTGGIHFDLVKRVIRDVQRAGQQPAEIIHQISETVYTFSSSTYLLKSFGLSGNFEIHCFTGISNVQGLYRARSTDSSYQNKKQVQSIYWVPEFYLHTES